MWHFLFLGDATCFFELASHQPKLRKGLAYVAKSRKWEGINLQSIIKIPLIYNAVSANSFIEGLIPVKKDGKMFYINKKGEYVKDYL